MNEENTIGPFRKMISWILLALAVTAVTGVLMAVLAVSYRAIRWAFSV